MPFTRQYWVVPNAGGVWRASDVPWTFGYDVGEVKAELSAICTVYVYLRATHGQRSTTGAG